MPLNGRMIRSRNIAGALATSRAAVLAMAVLAGAACSRRAPQTAISPEPAPAFIVNGPADLPTGTHVRYHTRGQWFGVHAGRVAAATADTLWLRDRDMLWRRTQRAVPVARLRDLQFTRTDYPKEDKVGVAMLAGAIASWMLAASLPPPDATDEEAVPGALAFYSATFGSLVTGVVFAVVVPGDRYEPVPLPPTPR